MKNLTDLLSFAEVSDGVDRDDLVHMLSKAFNLHESVVVDIYESRI